jgi:hypothetical protein
MDYGRAYAAARGRTNTAFELCDFFALDVAAAGLEGAFDLVFTSITPAASGKGCMEKLMRMSRAYCYNASFVHASDSLAERVCRDVFDCDYRPRWTGMGFYALLNLLWLSGYYPETYYYNETRDEAFVPDEARAADCARQCGRAAPEDAQKVLRYLRDTGGKNGTVERYSEYRYGSVLWDVRIKDKRAANDDS